MTTMEFARTIAWLREPGSSPVPEAWIPAATLAERTSLGRLGAVAAHLLAGSSTGEWPNEIHAWLNRAELLPAEIANEIETAVKESPDEVLASLYAELVSGSRRRVLGTFFTPSDEVAPMLELWNQTQPAPSAVSDVGAGVGVFTAAAAHAWPKARVFAVDVNPVTLGLLGVRLAQSDMGQAADNVNLVLDDFTIWDPQRPRLDGERRLTLGNPPYTRSQLIPEAVRERLREQAGDLCGTRASLSAYITAIALRSLESDDGMCLLLPAQWLESDYARGLRRHLLDLTDRRVDLRLAPAGLFKDATVDAVVLMVGTKRQSEQPFAVSRWGAEQVQTIDRSQATDAGWRGWFADVPMPSDSSDEGPRFSEFAYIRRGVATGANSFFLLSDADRLLHELPEGAVSPVVRRLAGFGETVTPAAMTKMPPRERRWLLTVDEESAADPRVAAYLQTGLDAGIAERYLCTDRATWYDLAHDLFVPDVIITAMSRGDIRVVSNSARAAITNNLYGWRWHKGVSQTKRSAILTWLRSEGGQVALRAQARQQGDGLAKLEPRALKDLRIPPALFD